MKVISVMNYKGGVGKTTLTANLAAGIAARGKRVLMIDADPQMSLTHAFTHKDDWLNWMSQKKTIKGFLDHYLQRKDIPDISRYFVQPERINILLQSQRQGSVNLIASDMLLFDTEIELGAQLLWMNEQYQKPKYYEVHSLLRQSLQSLHEQNMFDVLLIDCPPNFGVLTRNALVASDYYLIPTKPDYLSTMGMPTLKNNLDRFMDRFNECIPDEGQVAAPKPLGIIYTMLQYSAGSPITAQYKFIAQPISQSLHPFKNMVRQNNTVFGEERRVPVILDSTRSGSTYDTVRRELHAIVDEMLGRL